MPPNDKDLGDFTVKLVKIRVGGQEGFRILGLEDIVRETPVVCINSNPEQVQVYLRKGSALINGKKQPQAQALPQPQAHMPEQPQVKTKGYSDREIATKRA